MRAEMHLSFSSLLPLQHHDSSLNVLDKHRVTEQTRRTRWGLHTRREEERLFFTRKNKELSQVTMHSESHTQVNRDSRTTSCTDGGPNPVPQVGLLSRRDMAKDWAALHANIASQQLRSRLMESRVRGGCIEWNSTCSTHSAANMTSASGQQCSAKTPAARLP